MAARVQLDQAAIRRALGTPEMRRLLDHVVDEGVRYAKSIAPDAPPIGRGYVEGLVGDVGIDEARGQLVGRVAATDFKSNWIEKGTAPAPGHGATPARHVLSRTLDHLRGVMR